MYYSKYINTIVKKERLTDSKLTIEASFLKNREIIQHAFLFNRTPFSEMNACWPLKDAVCRVVRDMTDETLLKNFGYLKENVSLRQVCFSERERKVFIRERWVLFRERVRCIIQRE